MGTRCYTSVRDPGSRPSLCAMPCKLSALRVCLLRPTCGPREHWRHRSHTLMRASVSARARRLDRSLTRPLASTRAFSVAARRAPAVDSCKSREEAARSGVGAARPRRRRAHSTTKHRTCCLRSAACDSACARREPKVAASSSARCRAVASAPVAAERVERRSLASASCASSAPNWPCARRSEGGVHPPAKASHERSPSQKEVGQNAPVPRRAPAQPPRRGPAPPRTCSGPAAGTARRLAGPSSAPPPASCGQP